jgi:Raf kinase inhibitor-like YbhB/YbcL family protein
MIRNAFLLAAILGGFQLLSSHALGADKQTQTNVQVLRVSSPAFQTGKPMPAKYTCDSANVSPPLAWSGAPPTTKSFALICEDPDAPKRTFTHWVMYNIPATETQLAEGLPSSDTLPSGAKQGMNDFNRAGYGGPCPPPGNAHRYLFKVYALDAAPNLMAGASKKDLLKAMNKHILAQGELTGTYARPGGK